ncbi:MAG TPA: TIGR03663 family protein, partial [Dehalococcoidia bacterium]|nr:TIGR03663 family protein [Dehalococcoidia bacterium]
MAKKAKRKLKAQRKEQATGKVDAQDRGRAAEVVEAPPAGRLRSFLMGEGGLYLLLIIIALVIRLWDLDVRAVHYDESAWHIKDSWLLYKGNGYAHTPVSHGPFQYFGTAFIFLIFGAGDFTARLLPALFGTALVGLPYFLRRPLGRVGAFVVALLLTFSPLFLYYSRYARNDIYSAFWALLLVVCIWRYFENRKARYLYIGA